MEQKINVSELLKDCPRGMELDSTICDNLYFDEVTPYMIRCYIKNDATYNSICFHHDGSYLTCDKAKCVIFPKGETTWEGFQRPFKDGDIVATNDGGWIGITTGGENHEFIPTYCVIKGDGKFEAYFCTKKEWSFGRLATEEEKEKLFRAIKDNGYKWNPETKTLEKIKKEYPKTYNECAKVLLDRASVRNYFGYKGELLVALQKLLVCRDAYWKLYGEEMGFGKPWEPENPAKHYIFTIETKENQIICNAIVDTHKNRILSFPTKEMRDAFYENFKELIESVKELL